MKHRTMKKVMSMVCAVALLGACSSEQEDSSRPLSRQDAELLAQVLFRNYEAKGARFEINTRSFTGAGTVSMLGIVDWENHTGLAMVYGYGTGADTVEAIAWTSDAIAERRPGWATQLEGKDPESFFVREVSIENQQLDRLVAVLVALAGTTPENPQLILQNEGAEFVRMDTLRGRQVTLLRYSAKNLYWIDSDTGQMLRMEALDSSGNWPIVVDILDTGPQTIPLPPTVPYPT